MHRRDFLKLIVGGVAGLSAASLGCPWAVTAQVGIRIWIGPFQWRERISSKTGLPSPAGQLGWRMPVGALQAFDIRGPQGVEQPGALSPLAIFVTPGDVVLSAPYVQIASDPLETLTGQNRSRLIAAFGRNGNGARFIDLLHDLMTRHADLSRASFCPPRIANSKGRIEWAIAGQVWKSEAIGPGSPEWNGVVARHRRTYEDLLNSGVKDLESKYLATVIAKYKLSEAQGVETFIRPGLPRKAPVTPETTLTESFPGSSATLGGDQTWTEISGTWANVSGVGQIQNVGSTSFARCESVVSTDDMRVTLTITVEPSNSYGSGMLRFAAAASTGYAHTAWRGANDYYCTRYSAGSGTDIITSELSGAIGLPTTDKIEMNGDVVEIFEGANSRGSTTDTNISGNVRAGLVWYAGGTLSFDDWIAEDLAAPPAVTPRRSAVFF